MPLNKGTLGLIAGGGRLPFLVAEGARRAGVKVICAALADNAENGLSQNVDVFIPVPLARPGTWIKKLRAHGVTSTIMVGKVEKKQVYTPAKILKYLPDWKAVRIWYWTLRNNNKQNETILTALAEELARGGIILEDSTKYCPEHLAEKGVITKSKPSAGVTGDIEFGWSIVKTISELDIGQAITVKEKEVIAVEAIEGTSLMLERTGRLCPKGGWTLIKTAKPGQDMRFDVPCIGPDTIRSLSEYGGRCIAVEAEKTLIIDKPETIGLADQMGIAVVGY